MTGITKDPKLLKYFCFNGSYTLQEKEYLIYPTLFSVYNSFMKG